MENRSLTLQAFRGSKEAEKGGKKTKEAACIGSNGAAKGMGLEPVIKNHGVLQRKFQSMEHFL